MSNSSPAVYHCPSCGALAQADPDGEGISLCGECGHEFKRPLRVAPRHSGPKAEGLGKFVQRDVVSRRRLVDRDQSVVLAELPPPVEADKIVPERGERPGEEMVSDDGRKKVIRRRKRKRKTNRRPYVLTVLWLLVVVAAFYHLRGRLRSNVPTEDNSLTEEERQEKAKGAEAMAHIRENFDECQRVLGEFLAASDTAGRAQFVYDPLRVTPLMDRYTEQGGMRKPEGVLRAVKQGLIVRDSFRAIETLWQEESGQEENGQDHEVTFIRSDGMWRIDWEAYTTYSTTPWQFFVRGAGPSRGEFRLFARKVPVTSVSEEGMLGLRFYPPIYDDTLRYRRQSPKLLLRASSPLGEKLESLFAEEEQKTGWGEPSMHERDPVGLVRVRVVLEWEESDKGSKNLLVKELKAGHWLGVELDEGDAAEDVEEPSEG